MIRASRPSVSGIGAGTPGTSAKATEYSPTIYCNRYAVKEICLTGHRGGAYLDSCIYCNRQVRHL